MSNKTSATDFHLPDNFSTCRWIMIFFRYLKKSTHHHGQVNILLTCLETNSTHLGRAKISVQTKRSRPLFSARGPPNPSPIFLKTNIGTLTVSSLANRRSPTWRHNAGLRDAALLESLHCGQKGHGLFFTRRLALSLRTRLPPRTRRWF